MPEVSDYFPEYKDMEQHQLFVEKDRIQNDPTSFESGQVGAFSSMKDEALARLLAITRALRKKAAAPGSGGSRKRLPREKSSVESIA